MFNWPVLLKVLQKMVSRATGASDLIQRAKAEGHFLTGSKKKKEEKKKQKEDDGNRKENHNPAVSRTHQVAPPTDYILH